MNLFWILVGIFVLGLMVLVHEWGHFIVAKLLGVRVDVFSIGFGPRLFGRRRGDTDYRVSILPLGGYVRMAGDSPGQERAGAPCEFLSKPRWQRVLIALAGPTMNILMAVVLLAGVFAYRYERPAFLSEPAVIGSVREASPAARAGFEPGDRLVRFGQVQNPTWEEVLTEAALSATGPVPVEVERAGSRHSLQLDLPEGAQNDPARVGWLPDSRLVVQTVLTGSPGERGGLRPGDVLLAFNGEPLRPSAAQENPLSERLQQSKDQPVVLTVDRQGAREGVTVTPVFGDHPAGKRWVLGVTVTERMERKDLSLGQALGESVEENVRVAALMVELVGRLLTRRASLAAVSGPVGIVRISGEAGQQGGWLALIHLMAAVSLSLGILNLFPIPILDGGHIVMLAIEGALRRDLSLRLKEIIIQVGLVFLVLLFVVVLYNDIARIFTN